MTMSETERSRPRVAVIGVGTMGAMTMWHLAAAGFDVVGFERYGVPHDRGAHGAETRIYRMAYREGAFYIPLLKYSHSKWLELTASAARPVFTQNGCLYISDGDRSWLDDTITSADAHGIPFEELDDRALAARYPQHRLLGGERAILDLSGGTLRPELAVLSAAEQALRLGATIRQYTAVDTLEPTDDGVTVVTSAGQREEFDYAVVTSGPWTGLFQRELGFGITARRLPGTWYAAESPADFVPARFPVCIRSAGDIDYSGFPSVDGWTVKVMPPVFPDTETVAEQVDREIHPRDIDYTRKVVATLLNGLSPDPVRTGVFMDGFTESDIPVIDYSSVSQRIVGAVGFGGHGFKMSPAVGQMLTELLLATEGGGTTGPLAKHGAPFRRESHNTQPTR